MCPIYNRAEKPHRNESWGTHTLICCTCVQVYPELSKKTGTTPALLMRLDLSWVRCAGHSEKHNHKLAHVAVNIPLK